jgi:hypothetical protein
LSPENRSTLSFEKPIGSFDPRLQRVTAHPWVTVIGWT